MKRPAVALALVLLAVAAPAYGSFHDELAIVPDRDHFLLMTGTSFNGLHAPDAPLLEAFLGERVRFTVLATEAHTFHLHGHPWLLADGRVADTVLVDVDTPHVFDVPAGGVDAHAGDWLYHCHVDAHLQEGMWGIFRVYPYATRIELPGPAIIVTLDRLGEPLDGATLALAVDDVEVPAHVEAQGDGRYLVHAPLPSAGALVVTATHPVWGESVSRASLDGSPVELPTFVAGPHAHAS